MKTKQQEIEILRSAIKQLGADSYLGPWLSSVAAEVEQMIRSDYFPRVSLKESEDLARMEACSIVGHATAKAKGILEIAERESKEKVEIADRIRNSAVVHLEKSVRELRGW